MAGPDYRAEARSFDRAVRTLRPASRAAAAEAAALSDRLTKPRGALGLLETLGAQLAGIAGCSPPPLPAPAAVGVFAADHGVVSAGVTPWPSEVTAQMVANFCAGGAAISVLARQSGARVLVVDVGVGSPLPQGLPQDCFLSAKVRAGTGNIAVEPAMSVDEAVAALDVGSEVAGRLVAGGAACLVTGEMGIGNTTPSAAVIASLCGRPPAKVTGRGTGIDDEMLARKIAVVSRALARIPENAGPIDVLASVGGLEIAALAGFIVGGASARRPVIIDGLIAGAAALVAHALAPDVDGYVIGGHLSSEPGAAVALAHLGVRPVLDLDMRLGEGTGACLAVPVVEASARILREMATFDAAGVTDKDR
jgi:nicotinate-nucleotide--dimethylbenzimidazole phosphoribosyltransferase